ncbi:MAG: RNA polymerase sigma factor, partial [Candidatus Dormibacteraeota bacterium]|nr:RNA polymerase sigma factor [Candidatus Dormibacteraeota bacterium]
RNRVRARRGGRILPLDGELNGADREAGPERVAVARAEVRRLAEMVAALPAGQRAAVVLRCVQGLSASEAAGLLGVSEVTVRSNVHRGLAALRGRAAWLSEVS